MDVSSISVPFSAESVDAYEISPATKDLQIIKLANNNIFRIKSDISNDFMGFNIKKTK